MTIPDRDELLALARECGAMDTVVCRGADYVAAVSMTLDQLESAFRAVAERDVDVADFAEWLAREMPAGTVIGDPNWWAPRILKAINAIRARGQR